MWINIFVYVLVFILILLAYFKWSFHYWKRHRIPYLEAKIPFGTISNPISLTESISDVVLRQYKQSKDLGYKYVGLFALTIPQLMILDPTLIKRILVKDFNMFTDRGFYFNEKEDPLSAHLFTLSGEKWKKLRAKLTPTFTSCKIKLMTGLIVSCGYRLRNAMSQICDKGSFEVKDILERYTTDVIGNCAFGIDCNSFSDPNSDFCKYSRKQFLPTKYENFKMFVSFMFPSFSEFIGMKVISTGVTNFFMKILRESVHYRKENNVVRNDFLQILIDLMHYKDQSPNEDVISFEQLAAQSFLFFSAGFETSSSTMGFCLFELSLNQSIQKKVRDEIISVLKKHSGAITDRSLKDMKYLHCVINEVLRKYPPIPILNRKCIFDYKIPESDIVIKKGINIIIPSIGLQNDPEFFPNPDQFNPERFEKTNLPDIVPFTYLPFGEGSRSCLGDRFGLLQTKIGLLSLLKDFKFSLSDKMELPIKLTPISFVLSVESGIWLNAEKI